MNLKMWSMRLEVIKPIRHARILGMNRLFCSGQKIMSLKTLNKYIVDDDDKMFFQYEAEEVDHTMMRKMIDLFPECESLRTGDKTMLDDVEKFYTFNLSWRNKRAATNIKMLYESLMIYFLIKKHKKGT